MTRWRKACSAPSWRRQDRRAPVLGAPAPDRGRHNIYTLHGQHAPAGSRGGAWAHQPATNREGQRCAAAVTANRAVFQAEPSRLPPARSEEHTSELPSLMRNSYAVFCLKTKKNKNKTTEK